VKAIKAALIELEKVDAAIEKYQQAIETAQAEHAQATAQLAELDAQEALGGEQDQREVGALLKKRDAEASTQLRLTSAIEELRRKRQAALVNLAQVCVPIAEQQKTEAVQADDKLDEEIKQHQLAIQGIADEKFARVGISDVVIRRVVRAQLAVRELAAGNEVDDVEGTARALIAHASA